MENYSENVEKELPIHSENVEASLDGSVVTESDVKKQDQLDLHRRITNFISIVVVSASVAAIVLEVGAMYLKKEKVVYAAGVIGLIIAPSVIAKQLILAWMGTLRSAHNKIRMEINRFMEENNKLHTNVTLLEIQVKGVKEAEDKLALATGEDKLALDELVQLVEENEKYVKRLNTLAMAEFQEQLLTMILKSDKDSDMRIEGREVRVLLARFKGKKGFHLDEEKFLTALQKNDGSILAIMAFLRGIGDE